MPSAWTTAPNAVKNRPVNSGARKSITASRAHSPATGARLRSSTQGPRPNTSPPAARPKGKASTPHSTPCIKPGISSLSRKPTATGREKLTRQPTVEATSSPVKAASSGLDAIWRAAFQPPISTARAMHTGREGSNQPSPPLTVPVCITYPHKAVAAQ